MEFTQIVSEAKKRLLGEIKEFLKPEEIKESLRDPHAKRPPRPCGITIHTAIGCVYECKYCYIYDMGFNNTIKPYPLSGLQLVYALLSNKYFIPGERGTYLAIGSVSEPFHPVVREKTLDYVERIYQFLGNPTQFSTKQYIDKSLAERLYRVSNGKMSPLVTIVTLNMYSVLEPKQIPPEKRLESIRNLREAGLKPFLFLRPIIPGVTEREYREIIDLAQEYGAVGIVAGSLRVTRRILDNLKEAGLDISEITRRLAIPIEKMKPGIQYDVYTRDLKNEIEKYTRGKGLIFYSSACMANLYTHGLVCWKMLLQEHRVDVKLEAPSRRELENLIGSLGGKLVDYTFKGGTLDLKVTCRSCDAKLIGEYVRARYLACTRVYAVGGR